jgi:hypothetical protein
MRSFLVLRGRKSGYALSKDISTKRPQEPQVPPLRFASVGMTRKGYRFHRERSLDRGICSSADLSWKCFSTGGVMVLRPTQGNEKRLGPASTLYGTVALSLSSRPKRSGAEGPAVPRTFRGNVFFDRAYPDFLPQHLTRPRVRLSLPRVRLSLTKAAWKFANATKFNRKSEVAQWRDLRFLFSSVLAGQGGR